MQESTESDEVFEESGEASSSPTVKKPAVKPWIHQTEEAYRTTAEKLVHFSSKTVNSNTSATGIRLAASDGLDLPYVSVRTLIDAGVQLELDYISDASQAGIVKQIMACQTNDPFAAAATAEEKACIQPLLQKIRHERFELGTDRVDLRLRQLLIPKEDAPGGYVSVTPITSGSVCHILFDPDTGLVPLHNRKTSETRKNRTEEKTSLKHITQARMGIGGANPQNVGRLTRNMQQPILVSAPEQDHALRHALSLYYKGLAMDFSPFGPFWEALQDWRSYLDSLTDREKNTMVTNMRTRQGETNVHLHKLCAIALAEGETALSRLTTYRDKLPEEHRLESGAQSEYELVSRKVSGVIRGLIDPRLRKTDYRKDKSGRPMNWPRELAEHLAREIVHARHVKNGESILLFPLDATGRADLELQLEEILR